MYWLQNTNNYEKTFLLQGNIFCTYKPFWVQPKAPLNLVVLFFEVRTKSDPVALLKIILPPKFILVFGLFTVIYWWVESNFNHGTPTTCRLKLTKQELRCCKKRWLRMFKIHSTIIADFFKKK